MIQSRSVEDIDIHTHTHAGDTHNQTRDLARRPTRQTDRETRYQTRLDFQCGLNENVREEKKERLVRATF